MRLFAVGLFLSVGAWSQPSDVVGISLLALDVVLGAGGTEAEALGRELEAVLGDGGASLWLAEGVALDEATAVVALATALGVGGGFVCEGEALGVATALEGRAGALPVLAATGALVVAWGWGFPGSLSALHPTAARTAR